ncbi:hypothetical protein TeGR_g11321 [Tetraparma gracilis]|uniref:Uncharacterized protein n=1 Tax=Tetraparma gracilis TaxID=2962635 RepID=A0ABQ6MV38_9STRA|nr:hypothetical protein TeGR_g11321 [Tetraparma gracilis]
MSTVQRIQAEFSALCAAKESLSQALDSQSATAADLSAATSTLRATLRQASQAAASSDASWWSLKSEWDLLKAAEDALTSDREAVQMKACGVERDVRGEVGRDLAGSRKFSGDLDGACGRLREGLLGEFTDILCSFPTASPALPTLFEVHSSFASLIPSLPPSDVLTSCSTSLGATAQSAASLCTDEAALIQFQVSSVAVAHLMHDKLSVHKQSMEAKDSHPTGVRVTPRCGVLRFAELHEKFTKYSNEAIDHEGPELADGFDLDATCRAWDHRMVESQVLL